MPEPTPPKGAPTKKGGGGKLGRKVGPLPLWAWLGLGAGAAVVLFIYMRGRAGSTESGGYGGPEVITGSGGYSPQQAAGAGAPAENYAQGLALDPDATRQFVDNTYNELRGQIKDIEDAFERSGWSFEDQQITPPGSRATTPYNEEQYDPVLDRLEKIIASYGGVKAGQPGKAQPPKGGKPPKSGGGKPGKPKPPPKRPPKPGKPPKRTPPKTQPPKAARPPKPNKPKRAPVRRVRGPGAGRAQ